MSFVDRFYTFVIDFTAADRNIFEKIRLKLPKYPNEEISSLLYRILVYLHCYSSKLQFSANPLSDDAPTLLELDHQEGFRQWLSVGLPELKALRLNLRRYAECHFGVYFFNSLQIERFCHALRGTKENWVEPIQFFRISEEQLAELAREISTSSSWQVTQSENIFFMDCNGQPFQIEFEQLNIWSEYQASLLHDQTIES